MKNFKKFKIFLESLIGNGNDNLIESVKQGFHSCFEATMEEEYTEDLLDHLKRKEPSDNPYHEEYIDLKDKMAEKDEEMEIDTYANSPYKGYPSTDEIKTKVGDIRISEGTPEMKSHALEISKDAKTHDIELANHDRRSRHEAAYKKWVRDGKKSDDFIEYKNKDGETVIYSKEFSIKQHFR